MNVPNRNTTHLPHKAATVGRVPEVPANIAKSKSLRTSRPATTGRGFMVCALCVFLASTALAADPPAPWQPPGAKAVHDQAIAWLKNKSPGNEILAKAEALWAESDSASPREVLERLAATFALADDPAKDLLKLCSQPKTAASLSEQPWLADEKLPPLVARNLRLYYAIWLVQQSLFDEAREQLAGLRVEDVVDPASLLFHQAVVDHRLLDKKDGLVAIDRLLLDPDRTPKRYAAVSRLMREDLSGLKEDSLDHIARRMEDIGRRLDLGRAGPKVRKIEDGVIESLDKLIKELEKQQQQQQQQASAGGSAIQSQNPASDSIPLGGKGPGEVTKKPIGNKAGWGDLPPKQREEAMQQIGREFPSHYRDAAEQYFRRLAGEGSDNE